MDVVKFVMKKTNELNHVLYFNDEYVGTINEIQFSRESKYMIKLSDHLKFNTVFRGKYHKTFDAAASKAFQMLLSKKLLEEDRKEFWSDQIHVPSIETR